VTEATAPVATLPPSFGAPTASAGVDVLLDGAIEDNWKRAITAVNGRKRMLGAFLEESRLVGLAGGVLVLAMDDLHRAVVDAPEHRAMVQEELARTFGQTLELRCTPGEPNTHETRTAKADSLKPLIDRAMEVFDGEVIDRAPRGGDRNT
jgi:hypothetical protein